MNVKVDQILCYDEDDPHIFHCIKFRWYAIVNEIFPRMNYPFLLFLFDVPLKAFLQKHANPMNTL